MADQPGIEHRVLRIHGKEGTNEHKLNVPAPWHQAINRSDVDAVLVRIPGADPVIVMNVDAGKMGKWASDVARLLPLPGGQWTADRTSALVHRIRKAIGPVDPSLVSLLALVVDEARQRARVEVTAPLSRLQRAALDAACHQLDLEWDVPFDSMRPTIELRPVDPARSVIAWSDVEERKAESITAASIPLPVADDLLSVIHDVIATFREHWDGYCKAVRAAADRRQLLVRFKGTLPEFSVPGGKFAPFMEFKQAKFAELPLVTWLDLDTAFTSSPGTTSSPGGYELDVVPCIAIDMYHDGFLVSRVPVPRRGIGEQRATRGIVPLSPDTTSDVVDAVVAEIERLAASGISRKTWAKGYPPPAFPDRYDEVPPLHCASCKADMTAAAYGAETFVAVARCPSCGASHDVTFTRGEYAMAGLHKEKKASR
jgi:hypothetical protein